MKSLEAATFTRAPSTATIMATATAMTSGLVSGFRPRISATNARSSRQATPTPSRSLPEAKIGTPRWEPHAFHVRAQSIRRSPRGGSLEIWGVRLGRLSLRSAGNHCSQAARRRRATDPPDRGLIVRREHASWHRFLPSPNSLERHGTPSSGAVVGATAGPKGLAEPTFKRTEHRLRRERLTVSETSIPGDAMGVGEANSTTTTQPKSNCDSFVIFG
jgi:hypothetical protein